MNNAPTYYENDQMELKTCNKGLLSKSIEKTISAFSNSRGGQIICGVNDEGKAINLSAKELDNLQQEINNICNNNFNIKIRPSISIKDQVLIINIKEAQRANKPIFIQRNGLNKGTYIRQTSSNQRATEEDMKQFTINSMGGAESKVFKNYHWRTCFSKSLIIKYQELLNFQELNIENFLLKKQAIDAKGNATLFGLLIFSKENNLQDIIKPTVNIVITRYRSENKTDSSNLNETYISSKEFNGNVEKQFYSVLNYLIENLSYASIIKPKTQLRESKTLIPKIVLREILANCIVHRDYSSYSSAIHIDIFSNRIEFTNLGISLVDINNIETSHPATRNPLLARFFKDYNIVEQQARGIQIVQKALKEHNLEPAKFENIDRCFKSTIYIEDFKQKYRAIIQPFAKYELNKQQLTALVRLNQDLTYVTNSIYREINNMHKAYDTRKAQNDLKQLVELKILEKRGQNKATKYFLQTENIIKKLYSNKALSGRVRFNYSNNDGLFTVGKDKYQFTTKWSKSGDSSIHCYRDPEDIELISLIQSIDQLEYLTIEDFSSRVRTVDLDKNLSLIILKNIHGIYAAIRILSIENSKYNDQNWLEFNYEINLQGLKKFSRI